DKSNNGDGFYIETGNVNVDMRVYGETITGIEDIDNAGIKCDGVSEFVFSDGTKGSKCSDSGLLYFFYTNKKKKITLYLSAPPEWRKENLSVINHIAESISMKNPA
ncbi:MAG: hypothetical protein H7Y00_04085, partial [Fimbriimonadaceae bacterium]|nr:hypothetical protein [Chitinophagales bacterium]